jgi:hypothetical protein
MEKRKFPKGMGEEMVYHCREGKSGMGEFREEWKIERRLLLLPGGLV